PSRRVRGQLPRRPDAGAGRISPRGPLVWRGGGLGGSGARPHGARVGGLPSAACTPGGRHCGRLSVPSPVDGWSPPWGRGQGKRVVRCSGERGYTERVARFASGPQGTQEQAKPHGGAAGAPLEHRRTTGRVHAPAILHTATACHRFSHPPT